MILSRGIEGQVHPEPLSIGHKGLVEPGDQFLHSWGKDFCYLGAVLRDVSYEVSYVGGEEEVGYGVFGFEADDIFGDRDHQDIH